MEGNNKNITEEKKNPTIRAVYLVYKSKHLPKALHIISYSAVIITVFAFLWRIVLLAISDAFEIIPLLIITGVPFAAVSAVRKIIDAKRPYELYSFFEKKPKQKSGSSFPSRHVFSIFVIGTVFIEWNAIIGAGLLFLGALLAVSRVLLGIHFIRDVAAGALIGVICGIIGIIVV